MAALSLLLPHLQVDMPAVPRELALAYLRDACRYWCAITEVDTRTIEVTASGATTMLTPGAGVAVERVLTVRLDSGAVLHPTSAAELDAFDSPSWPTATGEARRFFMLDDFTLRLVPAPVTPTALQVLAVCKPAADATQIADVLMDHAAMLALRAKAMLALQPDKPWSRPELAGDWLNVFSGAAANERSRVQLRRCGTQTRVRFPRTMPCKPPR